MCDFNNLHANENGFILRCRQCGYYQIGFAGMMLLVNQEDYEKFSLMIEHISENQPMPENSDCRQLVIPTPYFGVNMLLSKTQINALQQLIFRADSEQVAQSMMAMLSHG